MHKYPGSRPKNNFGASQPKPLEHLCSGTDATWLMVGRVPGRVVLEVLGKLMTFGKLVSVVGHFGVIKPVLSWQLAAGLEGVSCSGFLVLERVQTLCSYFA